MAETKKILSWQEKLQAGLPLNDYDKIKRDAFYITTKRIRDNQAEEAYKAETAAIPASPKVTVAPLAPASPGEETETEPKDSKKGN